MTTITRGHFVAYGVCEEAIAEFDRVFPTGEADYAALLLEAERLDRALPEGTRPFNKLSVRFIRNKALGFDDKKDGDVMPVDCSFQVYNPLTGGYTKYTSLEAAKEGRKAVIADFILANSAQFAIAQELTTPEGNSVWAPLTEEQLK